MYHVGEGFDPGWGIVETGYDVVLFPAGGEEPFFFCLSDLFQGFQAVGDKTGAEHGNPAVSLGGQVSEAVIGGGEEPGFPAKAGLKAQPPVPILQRQGFGQSLSRRATLFFIGISFVDVPLGETVEAEEVKRVVVVRRWPDVRRWSDLLRQQVDVAWMVEEGGGHAQGRNRTPVLEIAMDRIQHCPMGGGGKLWIERKKEEFFDPGRDQGIQCRGKARVAVTHAELHGGPTGQGGGYASGLSFAVVE